jgi:NAD(P)-dependent dehydrogenase (short-subunit alcohol dehydrogenase family)
MKKIIVVAGATGNLGSKITKALVEKGVEVRVLVRPNSNTEKVKMLEEMGAKVYTISDWNVSELSKACAGASCVVSALSGLDEVIIDAQKILLDAAIAANVPRFIPSDYSLDFTLFKDGENRNLDFRRAFHQYLDKKPIAATTIFNGAFMDMLTNEMPLILFKQKVVLHWGSADHRMSFTTVADTAIFTANAALDDTTPRYLRIAGEQISPRAIQTVVTEVKGEKFRLFRAGGSGLLGFFIKMARFFAPAEKELYPAWQGMQYMHNMIDERSNMEKLDNNRYPNMHWVKVKDIVAAHQ